MDSDAFSTDAFSTDAWDFVGSGATPPVDPGPASSGGSSGLIKPRRRRR